MTDSEDSLDLMRVILERELGVAVISAASRRGDLVVNLREEAWLRAAEVAARHCQCDYLSFITAVESSSDDERGSPQVAHLIGPEASARNSTNALDGGVQIVAVVESTTRRCGLILKTDLNTTDRAIASWVSVYPGAHWHERELASTLGIRFDGHPDEDQEAVSGTGHAPPPNDFEMMPWSAFLPLELNDASVEGLERLEGDEG